MGGSACRSGVGDETETSLGGEGRVWLHQADKLGPPEEGTTRKRRERRSPLAAGQIGPWAPWLLRNAPGGASQAQFQLHIKIPWELFKGT